MQGEEFYNSKQNTKVSQLRMYGFVLALCVLPATLSAQGAAPKGPHCFAISVRLNGQAIVGPQAVTLKTSKAEDTVSLGPNCFQVPDAMTKSELIEVSFTLPGNQIRMSDVPADFFNGSWDVDLADKKFGKDVFVPKHVNAGEACAVVFRGGDSAQSLLQPQCRTLLAGK